jgi:hypothetical protein
MKDHQNVLLVTTGECLCPHMNATIHHLRETLPAHITLVRFVSQSVTFFRDGLSSGNFYPGETSNYLAIKEWTNYVHDNPNNPQPMGNAPFNVPQPELPPP